MTSIYKIIPLTSLLLLIPNGGYAESPTDEGIYYYYLGQQAGKRFQETGKLSEIQVQQALKGFATTLRGQPARYSPNDIQQALEAHHEALLDRKNVLGQQNLQAGERYLAMLETKPGYNFLDQGMAYRIDTAGTGDIPAKDSQVRLQYVGKHIDDTEFDRSTSPVWQSIQGVLPGWRVALLKMPAGSKWTLVIPPHLAYGESGAADRIGPHETLVFEIHLLEVH